MDQFRCVAQDKLHGLSPKSSAARWFVCTQLLYNKKDDDWPMYRLLVLASSKCAIGLHYL